MRQCFADYNKFSDFRSWTLPKDGIFNLSKFAKLLESWLPVKRLEELKLPTVVCATNLDRGTQVGWVKGEIVPRVVASCSIPIVFSPVEIKGSHYVDGECSIICRHGPSAITAMCYSEQMCHRLIVIIHIRNRL